MKALHDSYSTACTSSFVQLACLRAHLICALLYHCKVMAWPEKGQALRWLVVVLSLFGNFAEGLRIHVGPRAEECIEERVRDPSDTITAAFVAMAAGDKDGLDRQQKYDLKVGGCLETRARNHL